MTCQPPPRIEPDIWGYGAAALSGLHIFAGISRKTGRTAHLVEMAESGDVIVCASQTLARHVEHRLRQAGKTGVGAIGRPPEQIETLLGEEPRGRLLFHHDFVREFIEDRIRRASAELGTVASCCSRSARQPEVTNAAVSAGLMLEDWREKWPAV
ncbi:hypothetical protein HDIA_1959 [Hartmannibacter diazotrophicus]|uniref:Uncharacterized protein n=1 Tax=Hartmannibacter diazotrophicus TaxID=1482074 RepID=A0A2C9D5N6_9HYPH|nr:hypothetical protein [Hartmannibacter diazotrophicus]SON55500.1 hypothetical protein HDIA_1959 [Hartmannibacter diazotrophicus]